MTRLRSGAATDVGKVRRNNQDHYLDDEPLFAVADGMGGAAGGEEASQTAVAALKATFEAHPTADGLADGVRNANRAVWEKARQRPDLRGMGTTMTAVALVEHDREGEVLAVANVGDSRVYLLRDGELAQVTDDHSVPEELLRAGRLTPEEAASHPQRNVLTRALGIEPEVEVDCYPIIPYKGDRLVLASDGLFNEVHHDDIASVARRQKDPKDAAAELVRLARDGGGNDNITVVVVDVVDDGDRSAKASAAVAATSPAGSRAAGARRAPAEEDGPSAGTVGGRRAGTAGAPQARPAGTDPDADEAAGSPLTASAVPGTRTPAGAGPLAGAGAGEKPFRTPPPVDPGGGGGGRRITLRVVVFLVALVLVLAGAVAAITFFARGGYYVGLEGEQVAIFKGRPGGLLWFDPTIEHRTGVAVDELLPSRAQDLADGKEYSSLTDARRYVANLQDEAAARTSTTTTTTGTTGTTGTTVPASAPTLSTVTTATAP